MIKAKCLPAARAATRGRISERESENVIYCFQSVNAKPTAYLDEARCAGYCKTLAVDRERVAGHMDRPALARACLLALGMGEGGVRYLYILCLSMSPVPAAVILPVWPEADVLPGGDSIRLAEYRRSICLAPVAWKCRYGLEGRLVGSYGLDVHHVVPVQPRLWPAS